MKRREAQPDPAPAAVPPAAPPSRWARLRRPLAAVAAVGAVLSGLIGYWNAYRTVREGIGPTIGAFALPADAGPMSIVVLPFVNLTGDPGQAYVADGLTACITADLSRIKAAFVVGAGTAFALRDQGLTARDAGRRLGVRFVLQGQVLRSGSRLRIHAQLTDSTNNAQLWSELFEGDDTDLFALQDRVTTLIGNSMGRELVIRAAGESERRSASPTAADLLMRVRALNLKPTTPTNEREVEALSRQALALEPDNPKAMHYLASSLAVQASMFGPMLDPAEIRKKAAEGEALNARFRAVDPESAAGQEVWAILAELRGDLDEALRAKERVLELAPKEVAAYLNLASTLIARAQPQRAKALLQQAQALDPKHPADGLLINFSLAEFMLGNDDAAIEWGLKARELSPEVMAGDPTLAMAYARRGDRAKARAAMEVVMKADPKSTIGDVRRYFDDPAHHVHPAYLEWVQEQMLPALRLAGFPE